jgi:hypothetical protein
MTWAVSQEHIPSVSTVIAADHTQTGRPLFDLIVFDEAHHCPADTWTLVIQVLGKAQWKENGRVRKPFVLFLTGGLGVGCGGGRPAWAP